VTRALVLGGVRSGKSRYAEQLLGDHAAVTFVAPGPVPDGSDLQWAARVARHQADRPATWATLETVDLVNAIRTATTPLLIDCLGTWLTRLVDDLDGWDSPGETQAALAPHVAELGEAWSQASVDIVAVTNEVGMGVVPATVSGGLFRDELGRLNAHLSSLSDGVYLVVAGRVLDLSAAPVVEP
jgi:adenosylcobinamide kinase/adenosylcobinamide-phosphate guanylyltransferase